MTKRSYNFLKTCRCGREVEVINLMLTENQAMEFGMYYDVRCDSCRKEAERKESEKFVETGVFEDKKDLSSNPENEALQAPALEKNPQSQKGQPEDVGCVLSDPGASGTPSDGIQEVSEEPKDLGDVVKEYKSSLN